MTVWISTPLCTLQAEVDRLEGLVDAEAGRADYILNAAEENIDAFAESLHQQNQRHQRRKQAELQRQRQVLARAAAEELVRERRQRMAALREVRGFITTRVMPTRGGGTWAAWYNTWLLIKLTPKGVIFSFLF